MSMQTTINTRYELLNKLGAGGMGAVYLTTDRLTQQTVALKQVNIPLDKLQFNASNSTDDNLLALAVEFRTLAGLRHPHIISVLDYGFDTSVQPYFTMEYLPNAQTILQAAQDQPLATKVRLINEMLLALAYLHRRGVIHRDLKPDNVLVTQDDVVKVLDFGLARGEATESVTGISTDTAGTMAYMAPELFSSDEANVQSDLYAVGIMAYEIFAETYPFERKNMMTLVNGILHEKPDTLALDFDLADLLDSLLAKTPDARPKNADAVIHALCAATGQPVPEESQLIRESFLQASTFVGRADELQTLRDALKRIIDDGREFILVGGESGVGKSRLMDELRTRALVKGAIVLRGQAVAEGGLPFQLWRGPARRLALNTDLSDLEASILKEIVPDIGTLLGHDVPAAPELTGKAGQDRLVFTLVEVFKRQTTPIILILEDLQWTIESLVVLKQMLKVPEQLPRLLMIGTYRNDEKPDLPDELPGTKVLRLKRLDESAIADLSASMLGEAGTQSEVIDLLQKETEGNVFFMVEIVRALAEEAGRLTDIGKTSLPDTVMAGGVQQIIRRRLGRVPQWGQPLLKLAAVAGRAVDENVLTSISDTMPGHTIDDWLTACTNAAVLETVDGNWRFAHDKLRETLKTDLSADEVKTLNRQVAEAIEAVYPDNADYNEALLEYWHIAGNLDKEMAYLEPVALRLIEITAEYERAQMLIQRGLNVLPPDHPQRVLMWVFLAISFRKLGDLASAKDSALQAYSLAEQLDDQTGIAASLNNLGLLAMIQEDYAQATDYHQRSLAIRQALGNQLFIAFSLNNLGLLAKLQGDYAQAIDYHQRSLAIQQALGHQPGIASSLGNLGIIAMDRGDYPHAIDHVQRSLTIFQASGDRIGIATGLSDLGLLYLYTGDSRARPTLYKALSLAQTLGVLPITLETVASFGWLVVPERAAELVGLIKAHPPVSDLNARKIAKRMPELQAAITPEELQAALERGKSLDLDTVVTELLAEFGDDATK